MNDAMSPTQRASADYRSRKRRVIVLSGLLAAAVVFIGISLANGHLQFTTNASAQDCTKPGKRVGDTCSTTALAHGVLVTRTYVTEAISDGTLKAYQKDLTVKLQSGAKPSFTNLCAAITVVDTTPDHQYDVQIHYVNDNVCDPAQKAMAAGDYSECYNKLIGWNRTPELRAVITADNVDYVCGNTPKAKR